MGRSVDELLETVSSRDLAELRAYERLNGPIGPQYIQESLACMHEQLQRIVAAVYAVNVKDEDDIPEVVAYPRPPEIFNPSEE